MNTADTQSPASILSLVKQVQYRAYVRLEAVLQPLGITPVQFRILRTLSLHPGISSADLARLYEVKPQTMAKQIALLDAQALVVRKTSALNKRLLELRLSPQGESAFDKVQRDALALEEVLLEPLTKGEQKQLTELLERLARAWGRGGAAREDPAEFSGEFARPGVQHG